MTNQWNSFQTDAYSGMIAETITIHSASGEPLRAYYSRPLSGNKHPGIVLISHMPGWDEWDREIARRFTEHGYSVVCPDIFQRFGTGTPSEVSALCRQNGGLNDTDVMNDTRGSLDFLKSQPASNGRIGVIGMCSGGRHTFLAACTVDGFTSACNCWGGGIFPQGEDQKEAPIDHIDKLSIPLLGIFGNEDMWPTAAEVDRLEEELKKRNKDYEFHRYDGCPHTFWSYDSPNYRWEAAMESWNTTIEFFDRTLK